MTAGGPATNATVTVALKPPADAVAVAEPRLEAAIRFTVAVPVVSVLAVGDDRVPAVVEKLTSRPTRGPEATFTVARSATVLVPSAATLGAPATSVIPVIG